MDKDKQADKNQLQALNLVTKDGIPYHITKEGSLGLLALGHVGLLAWRRVRFQNVAKTSQQNSENKHQEQS